MSSAYLPPARGTLTGMFNAWVWSLANVTAKASCSRSPCVRVDGMFTVDWIYDLGEDVYVIIKAPQARIHIRKYFVPNGEWTLHPTKRGVMSDIFIMCFVLFVFGACFGWSFNAILAMGAEEEVARAEAEVVSL
jgi:hypothetical protein